MVSLAGSSSRALGFDDCQGVAVASRQAPAARRTPRRNRRRRLQFDLILRFVAWPKNIHLGLLFALWVNVGVAMVVSIFRRKFGRAAGQLALVVVGFFVYLVAALFSYCVPTRMTSAPCEEWIQERICKPTHIERSQLVFLGGIDMREEVVVFELIGELQDPECFVPGYAWGGGSSDMTKIGDHFRRLMKMGRVAVELPEEFDVSYFRRDGYYSILHKISAGGKTYLVFERL